MYCVFLMDFTLTKWKPNFSFTCLPTWWRSKQKDTCKLPLLSNRRSEREAADCPDGDCAEYQQNVWTVSACRSPVAGTEATPTQRVQSQCKLRRYAVSFIPLNHS